MERQRPPHIKFIIAWSFAILTVVSFSIGMGAYVSHASVTVNGSGVTASSTSGNFLDLTSNSSTLFEVDSAGDVGANQFYGSTVSTTPLPNLSFTSTGGLNLNAGGTNQNIDLNPTGSGATVATDLEDKGGQVFNVKAYGAVGNGTTNDTAAIQAAINAAFGTKGSGPGGEIYFPAGIYLVSGPLTIPNTGGSSPTQPSVRITGAASDMGWNREPDSGAELLMTYGSGAAKIVTTGEGHLTIDHLTFKDNQADGVPFIETTATTLHVYDCSFFGGTFASSAAQDAIILGGGSSGVFAGYGTIIDDNFFNVVRRAVWAQGPNVNSVWVDRNTIGFSGGSGSSGDAAIEFDGGTGNHIEDNLIEVEFYKYGIVVSGGYNDHIIRNDMWDQSSSTLAGIDLLSSGGGNEIVCGSVQTSVMPLPCETGATASDSVSDPNTGVIQRQNGSANNPTYSFTAYPKYGWFFDTKIGAGWSNAGSESMAIGTYGPVLRTDGQYSWVPGTLPANGGSAGSDTGLKRASAGVVETTNGGNGIGSLLTNSVQLESSSGPTWATGTSTPTGSCTSGSLYTDQLGSSTSTLYVCAAGTWIAK